MSIDINSVYLIGRLTRDPEISYTKNNKALCKFSLAVNDGSYNGQDIVYFFNIEAWGKLAETIQKYLYKGSQVAVQGKLKQNRYHDKNGENKSFIGIVANNTQFIGNKNGVDGSQGPSTKQDGMKKDPFDDVDFNNTDNDEIPF